MATHPTGFAGPHPDLREQICEMANMLVEQSADQYNWPSRAFVPDDLTIVGQRTWENIESLNSVINGGGFSAAVVSADIEGRRYGGLITAARKPGSDDWGLMSAGFGERSGESFAGGDTGGGGHRCIGFYGTSPGRLADIHAVEIEYFDGAVHRGELEADNCVIVYAPADSWTQMEHEVTVRYLDAAGIVVDGYSQKFHPGPRPPEAAD